MDTFWTIAAIFGIAVAGISALIAGYVLFAFARWMNNGSH